MKTYVTVSNAEMRSRVSAMVPATSARSAETEALRSLPQQTVDQLVTAGVVRMVQPEEFGGLDLEMEDVVDVGLELGRACGATAWMAVQWPVHNFIVGMFPRSVQETYWADSSDTLSSTCSAGAVTLEQTRTGARASGTLRPSSGVDWAEWLIVRDISNALAFLVSDEARYVTGMALPVDGHALIPQGQDSR